MVGLAFPLVLVTGKERPVNISWDKNLEPTLLKGHSPVQWKSHWAPANLCLGTGHPTGSRCLELGTWGWVLRMDGDLDLGTWG